MPTCEKCDSKFPSSILIDGIKKILNHRKYCLICSPYKKHNTKKLKFLNIGYKTCKKCKSEKNAAEFYSRSEGGTYSYCIDCWKSLSIYRQKLIKEWCVQYKGGKCERCGYNKYSEALDFHHRDKNIKEFAISQARSLNKEKLKLELDKCDLLCCRCHREVEVELELLNNTVIL